MTFDIATGEDTPGTRAANATCDGPLSSTRSFRATQSAPASSPPDPGSQHAWLDACSAATNEAAAVTAALPSNSSGGSGCWGIAGWRKVRSAIRGGRSAAPASTRYSGHETTMARVRPRRLRG